MTKIPGILPTHEDPLPIKPDVVMCADGAGEVVTVGQDVRRAAVGDRVAAVMCPRWIDGPIVPEYAPQIGGSSDGMLTEPERHLERSSSATSDEALAEHHHRRR